MDSYKKFWVRVQCGVLLCIQRISQGYTSVPSVSDVIGLFVYCWVYFFDFLWRPENNLTLSTVYVFGPLDGWIRVNPPSGPLLFLFLEWKSLNIHFKVTNNNTHLNTVGWFFCTSSVLGVMESYIGVNLYFTDVSFSLILL